MDRQTRLELTATLGCIPGASELPAAAPAEIIDSKSEPTLVSTFCNPQPGDLDMETAVKIFFSTPRFAVVGASTDPAKYGHKVLAWYISRSLPVDPINPRSPTISVKGVSYPTVASVSDLESPFETALSIITPPAVTLKVLEEAREAGISAVWMQPGSFDKEALDFANDQFKAAVAGDGGNGGEGWCVLVDGDDGLASAGRHPKGGNL